MRPGSTPYINSAFPWPYLIGYGMVAFYVFYIFWPVFQYPWWGEDDPMILYKFKKHGLLNMLISGSSWRDLTSFNFTPWLVVTLGLDLKAFGLNPLGFYLHQLITVLILALVLEISLRGSDRYGFRFFVIIIFFALYPVKHTLVHIYTRHYVEGLVFSILSILSWRKNWPLCSAFFYFLAMCSKEVFALLPVVFWAVYGFSRKSLFCLSIPAALYVAWRVSMLGLPGAVAGYGCLSPAPGIYDIMALPAMMANLSGIPIYLFSLVMAIGAVGAIAKMGVTKLVCVLMALLFPIMPVLKIVQGNGRYLFLLYGFYCLCVMFAWVWMMERQRFSWSSVMIRSLAFFLCAAFVCWGKDLSAQTFKRRMSEGKFVWEHMVPQGERHYLVNYILMYWHFEGLVRLRGDQKGPMYCHDAIFCMSYIENAIFWQWKSGVVQPIPPVKTALTKCDIPFEVRYDITSHTLSWSASVGREDRFFLKLNMEGIGLAEYELPPHCSIEYVITSPYPEIGIKLVRPASVCYSSLIRPSIHGDEVVWNALGK